MVDYWPRVGGVVGGANHKIQDTNCFMYYIAEITLNNGVSA